MTLRARTLRLAGSLPPEAALRRELLRAARKPLLFITDFGHATSWEDANTKTRVELPRYGVWSDEGRKKPEVVEVGDDLDALQRKYGPDLPVHEL